MQFKIVVAVEAESLEDAKAKARAIGTPLIIGHVNPRWPHLGWENLFLAGGTCFDIAPNGDIYFRHGWLEKEVIDPAAL